MNALQAKRADTFLQACRDFIANHQGTDFFEDAALFLSEKAKASYVLIGHLVEDDPTKIQTRVLVAKGKVIPNMTYSLYGTPCENVLGRNCCYFPMGVRTLFPEDKELQDLNIDSYIGYPLTCKQGNPLGLIVLMNETIIPNATAIEEGLEIFADAIQLRLEQQVREQPPVGTGAWI